jgi:hypothetical protein
MGGIHFLDQSRRQPVLNRSIPSMRGTANRGDLPRGFPAQHQNSGARSENFTRANRQAAGELRGTERRI